MEEKNVKLGLFVFSGFVLMVIAFFYISSNNNIFGSNATLKVRFTNASGLQEGSNVLFSGINAGTVESINIIDEKTIEVILKIDDDIIQHIPKNSIVSIGTEGLLGNKVLNIYPAENETVKVKNGDYLVVKKTADIDEMLQTLSQSNDNIAAISTALKSTALRIDNSEVLKLLNDKELTLNLKKSLKNIEKATAQADEVMGALNSIVSETKKGNGAAGLILSDKEFANDLQKSVAHIKATSENAEKLSIHLNNIANTLERDLNNKNGALNTILTDSTLTKRINTSLENIEKGTSNFNQNMEALKHNFLFRGYFKKLEKQKEKKD